MGYYVRSIDSNIYVDKQHFNDIYWKMCALNDFHDLKRGGSFGGDEEQNTNERYPKNKWFSWMEYNYPDTLKDMFQILQQVGFDYTLDDNGNLISLVYDDNKTGAEDYFLSCFAGYAKPGSFVEFKGEEDDDYFKFVFDETSMYKLSGSMKVEYTNSEKYEFGKPSLSDLALIEWTKEYKAKLQAEKALNN